MGHARKRPIAGSLTGIGEKIIVIEAFQRPTTIQVAANGATLTVAYTVENVLYDAAALAAVNNSSPQDSDRYVDPSSATWTTITLSGGIGTLDVPAFAVRINVTVAGGSPVQYHITQA